MIDLFNIQTINNRLISENQFQSNVQYVFHDFVRREYTTKYSEKFIKYGFYDTIYGKILIANTDLGICYLHFVEDRNQKLKEFKTYFYDCNLVEEFTNIHQIVIDFINRKKEVNHIHIHLIGTEFQKLVWKELVKIPYGKLTTYSEIAKRIGNDKASRAVGSAIGMNEIAFLIPCHRVIQKTGKISGFRWGIERKKQILIKELG